MNEEIEIQAITVGQLSTNCYLLRSGDSLLVVDPGAEHEKIAGKIDRTGCTEVSMIATHSHFDHIMAAEQLQKRYGCEFMIHRDEASLFSSSPELSRKWFSISFGLPEPKLISESRFNLGQSEVEILHTPGHTPGSISLISGKTMITGDTLFRGSIGRTDIGGSDREMRRTLRHFFSMEEDYMILPGHGEPSTLFREKQHNPLFKEYSS